MHTNSGKIVFLLLGIVFLPLFLTAQREWIAPGPNTNWGTPGNWSGGGPAGQRLEWKGLGTATSNNSQPSGTTYKRLYFSGTKAYTITGNQITLIDGAAGAFGWIQSASTVLQTINLTGLGTKVIFNDFNKSGVISTASTGTLTIGNVGLGLNLTSLKIYGENSTGSITISGEITGSKPIVVGPNEANDLKVNTRAVFSGNNSAFTGPITVESGSLNLRATNSDGNSPDNFITVQNNASLNIGGASPVTLSGKKMIISGIGLNSSGVIRNLSGINTISSDIFLANNATITSAGGTLNLANIGNYDGVLDYDVTFSGTGAVNVLSSGSIGAINGFSPIGNLIKRDAGLLTISAPCYFGGGITLWPAAKLQMGNNNLLPVTASLSLQQNTEFRTGGFSQQLSSLRLAGSQAATNSTIILTAGVNHTIRFGNSRNQTWNTARVLRITNWTGTSAGAAANSGKIFFTPLDASTPGLTEQQLSQILFVGASTCQGADLLPSGELVPSVKPQITTVRGSNIGGIGTPLNWAGYVGSTVTITGCNFSNPGLEVWVGGTQINPGSVVLVNANTITFPLGHDHAGAVKVVVQGIGERTAGTLLTNLGYVTQATGSWNSPATWNSNILPLADQNVTIAHANVRVDVAVQDLNPVLPAIHPLKINASSSLRLTANDFLPATTPLILAGGTLRAYDGADDNAPVNGFQQTFGTLTVTANSKITLGTVDGDMRFDASNAVNWTAGAILEIANWEGVPELPGTAAKIYVGSGNTALTPEQLRNIRFLPLCNGAKLLADGELVPSIAPFISTVSSDFDQPYSYAAFIGTKVIIDGCQLKDVHTVNVAGVSVPFNKVNTIPGSDLFGWEIEFNYNKNLVDGDIELISDADAGVSPSPLIGLGFASIADGNWTDPMLWHGGDVPIAGKKVTLFNELTLDASPMIEHSGLEIKAGGGLAFADGTTLDVNGFVLNNGTIQPASGSLLKIGNGYTLTNNSSFSSSDLGTVEFVGSGAINGTTAIEFHDLIMNAGTLTFPALSSIPNSTAPHPTVTGEFRINGGTVPFPNDNSIGPRYGPSSTLIYASGNSRNRGAEWRGASGTFQGQIQPGYPNHVLVTNGTTLATTGPKPNSATNSNENRIILAGNLTVSNGTVNNNMDRPLEVRGALILGESETNTGQFSMGTTGDNNNYLVLNGDLAIFKGSTFISKPIDRAIRFEGLSDGTISQPGYIGTPPPLQFYNVWMNKSGGFLNLNTPVRILESIELDNGYVNTTSENLLELGLDAYWTNASDASFVNGPLKKVAGESFIYQTPEYPEFEFPIGKFINDNPYYKPVKMANLMYNGQSEYSAEYFYGQTLNNPSVFPNPDILDALLQGVWSSEYWKVSGSNAFVKGRVTIPYEAGNSWAPVGPGVGGVVGVAQYSSGAGSWEFTESANNFGNSSASYRMVLEPTINDSVYSALLGAFDTYFTIGWGFESVLPIKLLYFTGHLSGSDVLLQWKIEDSKDLKHFVVEHGIDGITFTELGKVQWQEIKEYGYRHIAPKPGVHYYRLRMVEKSGEISYSRIVMVQLGVNRTIIAGLVQNPVSGGTAILDIYSAKAQTAEAAVFDMTGRLVFRQQFSLAQGKNNPRLSLLPLPSAQYRMLIRTADGVQKTIPVMK